MVIETHAYTHRRGRVGLFECECGCGQTFFADYNTRMPRYYNKAHRARAYRARAAARAFAMQRLLSWGRDSNPDHLPPPDYDSDYAWALSTFTAKNRGKI